MLHCVLAFQLTLSTAAKLLTKRAKRTFYETIFFGPPGSPILPDPLFWWALEVQQYVGTPTASHLQANSATGESGQAFFVEKTPRPCHKGGISTDTDNVEDFTAMNRSSHRQKRFSEKHGPRASLDPRLKDILFHESRERRLSCAVAFKIAAEHHVSPAEVGRTADLLELRLVKCQLGLFGYDSDKDVVTPVSSVPESLKKVILEGITDGRLPCKQAWQIAEARGLHKFKVAAACNALDVKIGPCQLGAF